MKLLTAAQIREADKYTIINEPVSSIDLMERAALTCTEWIMRNFPDNYCFKIFTGPGNNGGDGLAIARQLADKKYKTEVYQVKINKKLSDDSEINLKRLQNQKKVIINEISNNRDFPAIDKNEIIIDAIFGSGLSRPVEGITAKIIQRINNCGNKTISIDIPSGLFSEDNTGNDPEAIIHADYTLTFQLPKLSFFLNKNQFYTGKWFINNISLNIDFINNCDSVFHYSEHSSVKSILKKRKTFDHKGNFGHALLIAGSKGKMGASVLSAKACLKSGCGLITVHTPVSGVNIIQTSFPEAMCSIDKETDIFSEVNDINTYSAIGIGPGIGIHPYTKKGMTDIIKRIKIPLVIDADGLNILSEDKTLLEKLPENAILTPHPREFERLTGKIPGDYNIFRFLADFAVKYKCYLVYKEAYTKIATPEGKIYINPTGNPGMATAGSGDTLTGIILSFLAQGYSSEHASILAVYIHGLAADIYSEEYSEESLTAHEIINNLGKAFKTLKIT